MSAKNLIPAAVAACIMPIVFAAPARAEDNDDCSTIVVSEARQAKTARDVQKAAPNLVAIQSAEAIARYPDVNAAEALSRMPGVALSIDTGEGRFVNIRGLDGNLNGANFGGVVLLNTQPGGTYFNAAGRAVEFDTIPIGAIDQIIVTKSGLPDHDAEGIGGQVNLVPRTAIGTKKPFAEITLGSGIETDRNTGLYRDEIVVGAPFGGTNADGDAPFSFVLSQYLYNDKRSFDDLEAAYVDDTSVAPDKAYSALEMRRYAYDRRRFGYSGELDFTPDSQQRFYLRASLAGYNEHAFRNRLETDFNGVQSIDPKNPNGFVAQQTNGVKTLRDYDETHKNLVIQGGGDNHIGVAHLEYFAAYSRATYDKHYDYNSTYENPNDYTSTYDNITNPDYPAFAITSGSGFYAPSNYALSKISNAVEHDRDEEYSYAASVAVPVGLAAGDELKVGGKLRYRHKVALPYSGTFTPGSTYLLSDNASLNTVDDFYGNGYSIGPSIGNTALRNLYGSTAMALDEGNYFDDHEDVSAAFAQYGGTFGPLGVLAGLRWEHTKASYSGIGDYVSAGSVVHGQITTNRSYDNVFPTLQLRYQPTDRAVLRATYSTAIARPGFYQTQQSTGIDVGNSVVSTGNPDLKPITSNNFDVSAEYYLPGHGIISLGAFDKELRNYIVTFASRQTGYPGLSQSQIFLVQSYANVSHARVRGIEGQFVDHFTRLPGLLGGLGIDGNFTYANSKVALRPGETVAMPGTFGWTWNAAVFYERGPVKLRLASQFESHVLFGIGSTRATDVFQDSRTTLDANASYDVTQNLQFYANAKNLTNAPLRFYEGTPNRPIQREFYDLTLELGAKLHF